jgi:nitrite reductase/ring-hydroxylating ferredoxin subunit
VSVRVPAQPERVFAATLAMLDEQVVVVVPLAPDADARPREAIVLRDERGVLRAYRNLCQHLPVPLDAGSRRFIFSGYLLCGTHGARYRLADGLCVHGPCLGKALHALEIECVSDELFVLDAGQ